MNMAMYRSALEVVGPFDERLGVVSRFLPPRTTTAKHASLRDRSRPCMRRTPTPHRVPRVTVLVSSRFLREDVGRRLEQVLAEAVARGPLPGLSAR